MDKIYSRKRFIIKPIGRFCGKNANLKNIKFDEIIYNKDINLTEEEYKFMREIINKTKYILINSDEKIKIPENILIKIITFGFNSKSTIMISSVKENYIIISVQREIEKLNGDIIDDMAFSGHGCAISQASTSIMIDVLKGKTVEEAKEIIKTFIEMIKREITDEEQLKKIEDAIAFKNVSNMPARVKCALLAWHTLEDMLNKNDENGKGTINCCH